MSSNNKDSRARKYHVSVNASMTPEQVMFIDKHRNGLSTSEWLRQTVRSVYPEFPE